MDISIRLVGAMAIGVANVLLIGGMSASATEIPFANATLGIETVEGDRPSNSPVVSLNDRLSPSNYVPPDNGGPETSQGSGTR